jgi:hypothetical protein
MFEGMSDEEIHEHLAQSEAQADIDAYEASLRR